MPTPPPAWLASPASPLPLADDEADERPIAARTGPDPDDKESGGQPIRLSVAFQYAIDRRDVPRIYQTFGTMHRASYLRFAKQAITNEAQQFTPRAFWLQRAQVRDAQPTTEPPRPFRLLSADSARGGAAWQEAARCYGLMCSLVPWQPGPKLGAWAQMGSPGQHWSALRFQNGSWPCLPSAGKGSPG